MSCDSTPAQVPRTCLACHAPLEPEAAEGLCAACLLGRALAFSDAAEDEDAADLDLFAATDLEGRTLGDYEILSTLARGGMGIVFRARQRTTRRVVALKVISSGELATAKMVDRFHNEAQAAARLDHPHIVPIYEVGEDHGWHYFSMPLIEGPTLAEFLRARRPAPRIAVALLVKIARAVEHAHQRGILHRDLKPTNILLDAQGEPHLTDFGLAKVLEQDTDLTLTHAVLGTPAYMSPEQALGRSRDITTATDVYGLGAMLYELLTGRPPFLAESAPALLRKIVEEDVPPLAKARVAASPLAVSRGTSTNPPESPRSAPEANRSEATDDLPGAPDRDLEVICLKCLEKAPAKRYPTAAELADELDRWQRHEPILARPASVWERAVKWVRRNPARAGLACTLLVAPAVLTGASLVFNVRLNHARAEAERHAAEAQRRLVSRHLHDAAQAMAGGDAFMGALTLSAAAGQVAQDLESLRKIEQRLDLAFRFTPRLLRLWAAGGTPIQLQFNAGATRLIVTRRDGTARVWDLPANRELTHPPAGPAPSQSIASPDGQYVLELTQTPSDSRLWDLERQAVKPLSLTEPSPAAAFSQDGRLVALAGQTLRVLRVPDGALFRELRSPGGSFGWIGFCPDGRQLLAVDTAGAPRLWDLDTGAERASGLPDRVDVSLVPQYEAGGRRLLFYDGHGLRLADLVARTNAVVWTPSAPPFALTVAPDGAHVGFAGFRDQAMVWRTDTLTMEGTPLSHESGANRIQFSPDGVMLATAGFDYQLRLVDRTYRRLLAPVFHHHALVEAIAFSPDARLLAVGDAEGLIRVWDLSRPAQRLVTPGRLGRRTSLSPDGRWLGLVDEEARLWLTDVEKLEAVGSPLSGPQGASNVVFSPSARLVTVTGGSGWLPIWEVATGAPRVALPLATPVLGAAFSPDETRLVVTTRDGEVQRWDLAGPARLEPVGQHGEQPGHVAWGPDGRWIATADVSLQIWEPVSGRRAGDPVRHADTVAALRFSPGGETLVAAFANAAIEPSTARLYGLPALREVARPLRHGDGVAEVRFSPDSRLVATGGEDNVVQLWHADTGEPFGPALRHAGIVDSVGFDSTGGWMATGAQDGLLRLWDVERGELMAPPVALGLVVRPVAFSANGHILLAGNYARQAWLFNLGEPTESAETWEQLAICATGRRMDADGDWTSLSPAEVEGLFATLARARPELVIWPGDSARWHEENEAKAVAADDLYAAAFHRSWRARSVGSPPAPPRKK